MHFEKLPLQQGSNVRTHAVCELHPGSSHVAARVFMQVSCSSTANTARTQCSQHAVTNPSVNGTNGLFVYLLGEDPEHHFLMQAAVHHLPGE
jgi:hypothetical protein